LKAFQSERFCCPALRRENPQRLQWGRIRGRWSPPRCPRIWIPAWVGAVGVGFLPPRWKKAGSGGRQGFPKNGQLANGPATPLPGGDMSLWDFASAIGPARPKTPSAQPDGWAPPRAAERKQAARAQAGSPGGPLCLRNFSFDVPLFPRRIFPGWRRGYSNRSCALIQWGPRVPERVLEGTRAGWKIRPAPRPGIQVQVGEGSPPGGCLPGNLWELSSFLLSQMAY